MVAPYYPLPSLIKYRIMNAFNLGGARGCSPSCSTLPTAYGLGCPCPTGPCSITGAGAYTTGAMGHVTRAHSLYRRLVPAVPQTRKIAFSNIRCKRSSQKIENLCRFYRIILENNSGPIVATGEKFLIFNHLNPKSIFEAIFSFEFSDRRVYDACLRTPSRCEVAPMAQSPLPNWENAFEPIPNSKIA